MKINKLNSSIVDFIQLRYNIRKNRNLVSCQEIEGLNTLLI